MAIAPSDLVALCALNRPEDDSSTGGGGKDVDNRPAFTQLAADDDLEVVSAAAGDTTQTITIDGRDAAGIFTTKTYALNGTTPVTDAQVFERVLSVIMDGDAVGIITVRREGGGATLATIPVGERGFSAQFIKAASATGIKIRYDKVFWINNHGSLALTTAKVQLTADPASRIRIGVHTAKDDSVTIGDRETSPGGVTFVDDSVQQDVPTGSLASGEAIGVWIEQNLPADDPPVRNTYTLELAGNTT